MVSCIDRSSNLGRHLDLQELRGVAAGVRLEHSSAVDEESNRRSIAAMSLAAPSANTAYSTASASGEIGAPCIDAASLAGCRSVGLTVIEPLTRAVGPLTSQRKSHPLKGNSVNADRHSMREALSDALSRLGPLPSSDLRGSMPENRSSSSSSKHGITAPGARIQITSCQGKPLPTKKTPRQLHCPSHRYEAAPSPDVVMVDGVGLDDAMQVAAVASPSLASPSEEYASAPSLEERHPSHAVGNSLEAAGAVVAPPRDGEWEVRQALVRAKYRNASGRAPQLAVDVADAIHDRSPAVQSEARSALAAMGPGTAGDLIAAMAHASPRKRRSAAHALGELGTAAMAQAESTAGSALLAALTDSSKEVRQAGLEALHGTRCPASALARDSVRVEAFDVPPYVAPAAQLWTRSAHETFAPTSRAHLPPWTWRSRIKTMRAHRHEWGD
mmetsp:Transcript_3922/g.10369  ORF Transcript_3922/g.10369 Transcript_3922/m.10369 type:complete len:443 (+) Transcript_3922:71-1399(+)